MTTPTTLFVPELPCEALQVRAVGRVGPGRGVEKADVDIKARTVTVSHDADQIGHPVLIAIIEGQGYEVDGFREVS